MAKSLPCLLFASRLRLSALCSCLLLCNVSEDSLVTDVGFERKVEFANREEDKRPCEGGCKTLLDAKW